MVTTHISTPPKPGLLTIPGEIRNTIYRMLLTNTYAHQQDTNTYAPLHPAILRANRQIHTEAVNILHGENIWIIAKISAYNQPRIPATRLNVSKNDTAGNIKYPALHIELAEPIIMEAPLQHLTTIMGEESLDYFLLILWTYSIHTRTREYFKASSLNLTLCETPFHTKSKLQSTCLEPFGLVYGLRNLTIQGQVEPACVEKILHRAESGFKALTQVQNVSRAYQDKGDKAYFAGELRIALDQYNLGKFFLWHVFFLRMKEAPHQPFLPTDIDTLKAAIRETDSYRMRATLALGHYESARKNGRLMLRQRKLPNQARVHLTLCTARAHRALGEKEEESQLFEKALNAAGDKSVFLRALAGLFPNAATEQVGLLDEQHSKLQSGEAIDFDVIRAFWEAV